MSKKIETAPKLNYIFNLKLVYDEETCKTFVEIDVQEGIDSLKADRVFDSGDQALDYIYQTMEDFGWKKSNE